MNNSFFSEEELKSIGLLKYGKNVLISRKTSFYSPAKISIGDNVRIDDFCILSGDIHIGSYVHISAFSALYGSMGITIGNFSGISPGVIIFSAMDDFSGEYLINPMVPKNFTKVTGGPVIISELCQIGSKSIVFPNIIIHRGTVVGAMSLVKNSLDEWGIYAGVPAKYIKARKKSAEDLMNSIK